MSDNKKYFEYIQFTENGEKYYCSASSSETDEQISEINEKLSGKADTSTVTALEERVQANETAISNISSTGGSQIDDESQSITLTIPSTTTIGVLTYGGTISFDLASAITSDNLTGAVITYVGEGSGDGSAEQPQTYSISIIGTPAVYQKENGQLHAQADIYYIVRETLSQQVSIPVYLTVKYLK